MNSGGMMKSSFVLLLAIVVAMILPGLAFSQDTYFENYLEFNTLGGGARAAGMGGAFMGIAQGEYAYSWNPAAMSFAEKNAIGLQFNSASDKFDFDHISYSQVMHLYTINQAQAKRNHFNLDYAGFVVPFTYLDKQWSVGGGYRRVQDMGLKFETSGLFNSTDRFTQNEEISAISVGVSGKITENIGLGITANDYVRGGESNRFWGQTDIIHYSGNPIPDTVDTWDNFNSHYSGVNFDIGLFGEYRIIKGSFVVHTPYDLKQDIKHTFYEMIPPTPTGYIDRLTATTNIPFSYSVGVSAKPIEKLTFAADFDSRPMSKSRIALNFEMITIQDRTDNPNWENLNQFRIGAEYMFDAGFANVPIRVGFRNSPSVEKKLTAINGVLTDSGLVPQYVYGSQVSTNILTFGSGLYFQKAWIDLAYQFGNSSYNFQYNWLVASPLNYKEKRDYSHLFVSAGMNF
jgi:hypothetical protein